jgi:uncharacterized membrane protein
MTMVQPGSQMAGNYRKWALFAVLGLLVLGVIWADEGFFVHSADPEWAHIQPFKWWLMAHAACGFTALVLGPIQFSERFRRRHLALHRVLGRVYIGAILLAAPLAIYVGHLGDHGLSQIENWAQAGGWFLTAVLAFVFAVKRNIPRHRQWVARSYAFTFVFIVVRVPDIVGYQWPNDDLFVTFRWYAVVAALIVPDLILQWDELFGRRAARRAG